MVNYWSDFNFERITKMNTREKEKKYLFSISLLRLDDRCLFVDRHLFLTMKQEERFVEFLRKLDAELK